MLIKDIMSSPAITISPSATVGEAARLMLDRGISGLPVVDTNGRLRGIVTEGDLIRRDFDTFEDPLVYTPGDNEWTDCHRANNGAYDPLERLAHLREVFFDQPGRTLGEKQLNVEAQAGFPENVVYHRGEVTFAAANVPGSDNGLQPWTGLGQTVPTPEQAKAVADRTEADIALVRAVTMHPSIASTRSAVIGTWGSASASTTQTLSS